MLETLPPDQRTNIMLKMQQAGSMQEDLEEVFERETFLVERPELEDLEEKKKVLFRMYLWLQPVQIFTFFI